MAFLFAHQPIAMRLFRPLRLFVIAFGLTQGLWSNAAPVAPAVRTEIDALLTRLQHSGCEFNRNGSWHSGEQARAHLLKKLDYLEGKNAVQGTEQFIDLAASTSSVTGTPYLVRCGSAAPVPSQQWLKAELGTLRAAGK